MWCFKIFVVFGLKFLRFLQICPRPRKFQFAKLNFTSLIIAIGSESAKIKSRRLSRMSFHKNFTLRNFLAIQYQLFWSQAFLSYIISHPPNNIHNPRYYFLPHFCLLSKMKDTWELCFQMFLLIRVSLSEPQPSGTALHTCVYAFLLACLLPCLLACGHIL